jgi:methylated-DNA-[protein]-cysteine S-methyltransferase
MDRNVFYRQLSSPLGKVLLTSDGQALTGLFMTRLAEASAPEMAARWRQDDAPFREVSAQLEAYFEGEATSFDVPMDPAGTPFQRRVWRELCAIPYGSAISYVELARRIGQPTASRAVGGANGRNPISIIVPCHRVIAADGTLGGYGGGLDRKRWLLEHEAEVLARRPEWKQHARPQRSLPGLSKHEHVALQPKPRGSR